MSDALDIWQQRLEQHFSRLAQSRSVSEYPVFALENDLAVADLPAITELLRARLRNRQLLRPHWLVWVVYAAELGYAYDGQEYWQSFEDAMPLWREQGTRRHLRDWFSQFQKTYGGSVPTGPWAEHFSIIAWPITHSILPKDLQGQFARLLYTLRYELTALQTASSSDIGEFLRARSPGGSSRFDNLLEQTGLTGRLVHALTQQATDRGPIVIHPATLARITADLEQRQNSRDWLWDARAVLRNAQLRSSGLGSSLQRATPPPDSEHSATRPVIGLTAHQAQTGEWTLGLAYPDIQFIIQEIGVASNALDHLSVVLADQPDTSMPARALLAVSQRERPIRSLQDVVGKPLAVLRPALQPLSACLNSLRLPSTGPWLLRIQANGSARLVRGNHVRAGESYLIVSSTPIREASILDLGLRVQQSRTQGAVVYQLDVPDQLGPRYLEALGRIEIGYALRTSIEPVGLVPRLSGSDDSTVWLPDEEIILRLLPDMPVREFTIGINGAGWTPVRPGTDNETIVSLGSLPIGQHVIEVRAVAASAISARHGDQLAPEKLCVEIRSPTPWAESVREQAGFRVALSPGNGRLSDLTAGAAAIEIIAPPQRKAALDIECFDGNGHLAYQASLGQVLLPNPRSVRQLVARLGNELISEHVQSAPRVDVSVKIEELGKCSVSFRQRIDPLRWKLISKAQRRYAYLIDEAGADEDVRIDRYDIASPATRSTVERTACRDGLPIDPPGTLLSAKYNNRRYSAVLSVPGQVSRFADLGVQVKLGDQQDTIHTVAKLIPLYRLWRRAKPIGSLAPVRQGKVLDEIENRIASLVCGPDWGARLKSVPSASCDALDKMQRDLTQMRGFGHRMRRTNWRQPDDGLAPVQAFKQHVTTYKVSDDAALAAFAFQLAFDPASVKFETPTQASDMLERLSRAPVLARGAYFAKAMRDRQAREMSSEAA
jgi:hypothetical protein